MTENKITLLDKIKSCIEKVGVVQAEQKGGMQYAVVTHNVVSAKMIDIIKTQGIVSIPTFSEYQRNGDLSSIKCDVTVYDIDNQEDKIVVSAYGEGLDKQDKGIGKAQSYAMKYCFMKLFLMAAGKDEESDLYDIQDYVKDLESQPTEELLEIWVKENWSEATNVFSKKAMSTLQIAGQLHRVKLQGEKNGKS